MIHVRKFDGSLEAYDRRKVVSFCLRMGVSKRDAARIADKVEARLYDEIPTKKILQIARRWLRQTQPELRLRRDLRSAISFLRSKPDWEVFVRLLMKEVGYEVVGNQVLRGKCVKSEIDGILRKNSHTLMLEVKHHVAPHTRVGLNVPKQVWATYLDLTEGFTRRSHNINFTGALIVCNTKFSDEGKKFADCRGIGHLSWKNPLDQGVETLIEKTAFYPITLLREVDRRTEKALGDRGIVLLKQLLVHDVEHLSIETGIKKEKIEKLKESARKLVTHI